MSGELTADDFKLLVDAIDEEAIFFLDAQGFIRSWNRGAQKLKGYDSNEIIGQHFSIFYCEEDRHRSKPQKALGKALRTGRFKEECWRVRKDGSRFWASVIITALYRPDGEFLGFGKVTRDFSMRKRSETAQLNAKERLLRRLHKHDKAFEEVQRQHRLITDVIPVLISYLDRKQRYRFNNKAHEKWFGVHRVSVRGKTIREVVGDTHYEKIQPYVEQALAGETAFFEREMPNPQGQKRIFQATYYPDKNQSGRVKGFVAMLQDVTERRQIERELQKREQQLSALFEKMSEGVAICELLTDADGDYDLRYLEVNPAIERQTGFEGASVLGHTARKSGLDLEEHDFAQLAQVVADREARFFESSFGSLGRWFEIIAYPLEGQQIAMLFFDITDIRHAQEQASASRAQVESALASMTDAVNALKVSEKRFRTFTEAMPQMAFVADAAGTITYYNQRHYDYFGRTSDEPLGWAWTQQNLIHPDDYQRTFDAWTHSIETGEPYQIEYRLRRYDGSYRWHLGRAMPVRDDHRILNWLGTNTDIHEQKQIQERLSESVRVRDEFISVASHELKTPLTSMQMQIQLLQRIFTKSGMQAVSVDLLNRTLTLSTGQIERLNRLIEDMLDVARIASGRMAVKIESQNLSQLVSEVIERYRLNTHLDHLEIRAHIEEGVCGPIDRMRIEQVVSNLLSNAIKYGADRPVEIFLRRKGIATAELIVKDYGLGIAPEALRRIFDRFERAVSAIHISGLGLGLYIVKNILDAHHGSIRVTSELGKGSRFIVELPLTEKQDHLMHQTSGIA